MVANTEERIGEAADKVDEILADMVRNIVEKEVHDQVSGSFAETVRELIREELTQLRINLAANKDGYGKLNITCSLYYRDRYCSAGSVVIDPPQISYR